MNKVNVLEKILEQSNVFLSGGAGVGKSFLTNEIIKLFKQKKKNVAVLGSTAISAFNVGGVTLHSFFALGICKNQNELAALDKRQKDKLKKLEKIISKLDLIIIDEISMVSAAIFELVAFRLRSFKFSGKMLVVGDFCQLPPVKRRDESNTQSLFDNAFYAFDSSAWSAFEFKNLLLTKPKRTQNHEFIKHLSALRSGQISASSLEYFEQFLFKNVSLESLNDDFTLLCSVNQKADFINESKLARLEGKEMIFKAKSEILEPSLDEKSFGAWVKSLNLNEELRLKIGAKVIFCVNNYDAGYYNGEQGVITAFDEFENRPLIEITKADETKIILERFKFSLEELGEDKVLATFSQFPIKLAYAMTIHKAQGMSIERLACDVERIFENAQLYVALSRSSEPVFLRLIYPHFAHFKQHFSRAVKFDKKVLEFYQNQAFLNLEE